MATTSNSTLIAHLESATDIASLYKSCFKLAAELDFSHFIYLVRVPVSLSEPYMFALNGYPPEWVQRYQQMQYLAVDPVIAHVEKSLKPVIWDQIKRPTNIIKRFFSDARTYQVGHGITMPIYGRSGEIALLSLARNEPITTDENERSELIKMLSLYAPYVHEQVHEVALSKGEEEVLRKHLTPREVACLRCAADGMTSYEIGRSLDISERTVVFHLTNASEKLGVRSRQNAVTKAITSGQMTSFVSAADRFSIIEKDVPDTREQPA